MSKTETTWSKICTWLLTGLMVFTFAIPLIPIGAISVYESYFKTTCEEQAVDFEIEEREDSSVLPEDSFTETEGSEGSEEICVRNKEVVSRKIIEPAINEVNVVGIAEPEPEEEYYEEPSYGYRIGAICNDGSYSDATGRGACSWHGGVSEWLY